MNTTTLDDWQGRLAAHFEALRETRSARLGDRPVFALEHGLASTELDEISEAIRAEAVSPSFRHRLPWTVYAAEIGYRYSGDEYWQTFEKETPDWAMRHRPFIRRCFRDFGRTFGGAQPSGRWASRFSIICWPITHAILPKDLQKQLARILFQARELIQSRDLASPADLGRLISARSGHCSSRFRNLAEEPLLLGQISAALLLEDEEAASLLILPATLDRISEDVNREARARSWLRGARQSVRDMLQVRGGLATTRDQAHTSGRQDAGRSLSLGPTMFLRRATPDGAWDARLEVPDFSHVIERFPDIRDTLASSRCRVAGSDGTPKPGGWLLYGAQQVRLDHWPTAGEALLEFEAGEEKLDSILADHFALSSGPRWLFKVGNDGVARELSAHRVRPGSQYVLITTDPARFSGERLAAATAVRCRGVQAYLLDLPAALDADWKRALQTWGLAITTSLEIRPMGPVPSDWDGEGHIEWLTTDTPILAVRTDHEVDGYTLRLNGRSTEAQPREPGGPVVFELAGLEEGRYRALVVALDGSQPDSHQPVQIDIRIRQPRVWNPGGHQQSAFLVFTEPYDPSLEDLWEGRLAVHAHGPRGHRVALKLTLFEKGATKPLFSQAIEELRLPCSGETWSRAFHGFIGENRRVQNAYERASFALLEMDAYELGCFSLEAERAFTPLRWSVHHTRESYYLRAVDDRGTEDHPMVSWYSFDNPDAQVDLDIEPYHHGRGVKGKAGLYVLESGHLRRGFVVPPPKVVHSLKNLHRKPELRSRRRTPDNVLELLDLAGLWHQARLPGHLLAAERRRRVVEALIREMLSLIGGAGWAGVEQRIAQAESLDEEILGAAKNAVTSRPHEKALAVILARDAEEFFDSPVAARVRRFSEVAGQFLDLPEQLGDASDGSTPAWLCACCLRLATDPVAARDWIGGNPRTVLGCLLENSALVRAARFLVLATRRFAPPLPLGAESAHASWRWE